MRQIRTYLAKDGHLIGYKTCNGSPANKPKRIKVAGLIDLIKVCSLTSSEIWNNLNDVQITLKGRVLMARRTGLTREEIQTKSLAVGSDLIAKYGLKKFSMRQVANEIGYTVGTLYNVFKNQDDFLLQINVITLNDLRSFILSNLNPDLQGKDILLKVAISYYIFAKNNYARWCTLFEYKLTEETSLPAWYVDKIALLMDVAEQSLSDVNLNSRQMQTTSRVLWASVHGICALALGGRLVLTQSDSTEALINDLIGKYFSGLMQDGK